jgi:hypothetical protein
MADVTRQEYRELTDDEKKQIALIKKIGEEFLLAVDSGGNRSRESALARTKLEEAVMWAVKGITG